MAIADIGEYCSAASKLQGSCDTSLGIARGIVIFIDYVQDNAIFIFFAVALGALVLWLLSQTTSR